jgi:hypothetical protein
MTRSLRALPDRLVRGLRRRSTASAAVESPLRIPDDPRRVLAGTLDPELETVRDLLRPYRRRLWLRRAVRRLWSVVAIVAVAELALWTLARVVPIELAPAIAAAIPAVGVAVLATLTLRARPSLGEAAIAVDREGGLGDRAATALALAVAAPALAGPPSADDLAALAADAPAPVDEADEQRRFVRRQRRDALMSLRVLRHDLFRPRLARRPAAVALVALLALAPAILLPNPQDAVIAQARELRETAQAQADRLDDLAADLERKGTSPDDPRTRLARELRELARQLREHPDDLDANLARLGSIEAALRAQLDPANEQRAASLGALSRGLSRAATGDPAANPDGDPKQAADDLKELADKLDGMTEAERRELARTLTELQGAASQAGGAAAQALRDAAQSLAQGDTAGARAALDRLGEALGDASDRVATNRDLTAAANDLQDARSDLSTAGGQQGGQTGGQTGGQQGGQTGGQTGGQQGGQTGGQTGGGQTGGGQTGGGQTGGGQTGGGQTGGGQTGGGQTGGGQTGGGSIGGGGSNANYLGSGTGGTSNVGGPVNPNRPSELGDDLRQIFAPFDRLGLPGDPSYISGGGGTGQTTQGNQQGPGVDPGSYVPYEQVYADFYRYALTTLDRGYVPLSVRDFVRDYFSSLDPTQ